MMVCPLSCQMNAASHNPPIPMNAKIVIQTDAGIGYRFAG